MTQPELALQPLLVASGSQPVTAKSSHYIPVVPAVPVSEAVQPRHIMRRTIATLDLKVAITVDENTRLSLDTIEKIENELQAVRVKTRKNFETKIKEMNLDWLGEPPEKLMRCGVKGSVWTDSIS